MANLMKAAALKSLLDMQATCAVVDVRDPGEYNDAHIPGSSLVARGQLEFRMPRLVPFTGTQVIVCDDDGRRASLAAATLEGMGFRQVAVLDGGIAATAFDRLLQRRPITWRTPSMRMAQRLARAGTRAGAYS